VNAFLLANKRQFVSVQILIKSHKRRTNFFTTKCDIDPVTLEQISLQQGMRTDLQLGNTSGESILKT
jgi:hypothetical protein